MAATVNDRDLQLQGTSPRTGAVSIGSNIVVDQSNVTGLGLVVSNSKWVALASTSQIFQIPKVGAVTPSSITATAQVHNISGTPSLTIAPGGGTMSVTPTLTGGVFTFNVTQMTTDVVTLRLSATDTGGTGLTYTDDMTFVKVREGIDSLNVVLTNEAMTLPADYLGNVLSYSGASGSIKVYQGINDVTSVCTFALAPSGNPSSLTYSLNAGPGGSGGAYAVTAGYPTGTDSTTLTFRVTFGTTTVDKVFTIAKSKAGQDGAPGSGGTPGQRGSMQFYVTIAGTTWSSSTASSAVLTATGVQILNDVVTESNSAAGFAETRSWNGSAWLVINAVVDGNLLVTGTVSSQALATNSVIAGKVAANAISTANLMITSLSNLIDNPDFEVGNYAWTMLGGGVIDGSGAGRNTSTYCGKYVSASPTAAIIGRSNYVSCNPGDGYKLSGWGKIVSGFTGAFDLRLRFYDSSHTTTGTDLVLTFANSTSYNQVSGLGVVPAGAAYCAVLLYSRGTGTMFWDDVCVSRAADGTLIVDGSVTANKIVAGTITANEISATAGITAGMIDSRGLSIKDASGAIILSSGVNLDNTRIVPAGGWLNSNVSVDGSGNIQGIGTGNGTAVSNSLLTSSIADKLSKSSASVLSATVSINATAGAGFVAGTLTWNSAGVRTGGSGVAMTPGGLLGTNSSGAVTFSIDASTGNAYFAGELEYGIASANVAAVTGSAHVSSFSSTTSADSGFIDVVTSGGYVGPSAITNAINVTVTVTAMLESSSNHAVEFLLYPQLNGGLTVMTSAPNVPTVYVENVQIASVGTYQYKTQVTMSWSYTTTVTGSSTLGYKVVANFYNLLGGGAATITSTRLTTTGYATIRENKA